MTKLFAHSLDNEPVEKWEPLAHHLERVGERAAAFASPFGWARLAEVAGRLHDIGKCSPAYQAYIRSPRMSDRRGPDHSTAGAREAARLYPSFGCLLSYVIAGHHAGLADPEQLARRLAPDYALDPYDGWLDHAGPLLDANLAKPTPSKGGPSRHAGFSQAFLTRMLFSCLVDADFLETEAFYAQSKSEPVARGRFATIDDLRDRLRAHMDAFAVSVTSSPVNQLRAKVLAHALGKASAPPGFFTLTVPTGGGKTLASLSFALEHAVLHARQRVIYVAPFTSIIEQTADVFRRALGDAGDVLEHHASFDWEPPSGDDPDNEGRDGLVKLQRAAENWDAPVIVTTAVQFFEGLFAARTSRCRKLHNLAHAVIVLDEAQTLPLPLLAPCLAALDELQRNYGASVVLCTATQPALRVQDGALSPESLRLDIPPDRELAPDPPSLYRMLKRVHVEVRTGETADADIIARFGVQPQMLCIVNSRAHARALFDQMRDLQGAMHLTTLMCPLHRRAVLDDVRARLRTDTPVRLVATSLIEAGVDVDFPEVWRAVAGIDQIAQAAGRCNREGRRECGRVVVFEPEEIHKPPRALQAFWQAARPVLRQYDDPLTLEAVHAYFRELYWQRGAEAFDAARLDGEPFPILLKIRERAGSWDFPFDSISRAFRIIDQAMEPVIVPWRAHAADDDAESLLKRMAAADRPRKADLRRLQLYTVSIPPKARQAWLAAGVLSPLQAALGDTLLMFRDLAHYRSETGLDLSSPEHRAAEANVI